MVSLRSLAPLAALLASAAADPTQCSGDTPLSCSNNTVIEDTCCFVSAGLLVLTQFWDAEPATGPSDSWTIHGLWPDWCDGSYPASCDPDRAYTNISDILTAGGAEDTLSYMSEYWKDYQGDDESFWEHEWEKHGTCVSTLDVECYTDYQPTEEAVPYFEKTVELFKKLPTYDWLSEAGITPSSSETYALADIQTKLDEMHGAEVFVGCDGEEINEVWYFFNVQGSLQSGTFEPAAPAGTSGSCPDQVMYPPKPGGGNFTMPRAFRPE